MYRRKVKTNENILKKEEHKETPVLNKSQEPVISKIIVPPKGEGKLDGIKAPIANILRNENYIKETSESYHSVSFNKMIDILFSKGYLNPSQSTWYSQSGKAWSESYTDTTNWGRKSLMCGDIIFSRDSHKTIAFIISTVYNENYGKDTNEDQIRSQIILNPTVGGDDSGDNSDNLYLSTFSDCNGTVYAFKKGVTLKNLKDAVGGKDNQADLISYFTDGDKGMRKLTPSNVSVYDKETTEPNFTAKSDEPEPDHYPKQDSVGLTKDVTTPNAFNLTTGVIVEGWFVYMKSKSLEADQNDTNIIGDVIKSGPVTITIVNGMLNLSSNFQFSYPTETQSPKLYYSGNDTKFTCEPLNSEHYQTNFGDTVGTVTVSLNEMSIKSLSEVITHLGINLN